MFLSCQVYFECEIVQKIKIKVLLSSEIFISEREKHLELSQIVNRFE